MPPKEALGPLELDVLQYVGDHHPISVREVAEHFAETTGRARTTLLTTMERLRAKGFLRRRKVDGLHLYCPTVGKAELLRGLVAEFVDASLGGAVSPFVAYLSQSSLLTPAEAREIEELLKRLEAREKEGT
ncbi:MAG TPA: BlaI/MecI/CopY family transcriptional regulator [Pirellulales bacterium]|nr:BlaI/MecI/CopY family transcriptional regulator [Pirellulales bacterium]